MRNIYLLSIVALLVSALSLSSCQENKALGDWDPMELSEKQLVFDNRGGECTVYCSNYKPRLADIIDKINGKRFFVDTDHLFAFSAPGISVSINDNKIIVSVEPSEDEHKWSVGLKSGNSFSGISVYQNCKPDK